MEIFVGIVVMKYSLYIFVIFILVQCSYYFILLLLIYDSVLCSVIWGLLSSRFSGNSKEQFIHL